MRTRTILRLVACCLLAFLGLSFVAGVYLVQPTLQPTRRLLSADGEMHAREMSQRHGAELTDVAIPARDGATLRAWIIEPRNNNGNAVILLHGLSDNRQGMMDYAEMFLSDGFNILMPDARAHGASGGQLATFGLLESDDIPRWLRLLQDRGEAPLQISCPG